jgi:hypothetical protein
MEAVHRYEDTVNQVIGDGIMALIGGTDGLRRSRRAEPLCGAPDAGAGDRVRRGGPRVVRAIGSDLHMDLGLRVTYRTGRTGR